MDGRQSLPSYFLHQRIGSPPVGFRQLPSPNPGLPVGPAFPVDSPAASNVGGGVAAGEPKKKRGRPRKYGPDGSVSLGLSPMSKIPAGGSASEIGPGMGSGSGPITTMPKRGRGRPPGTGRKQQLASLGEWIAGSAGMGFTPHAITIPIGEDVAAKIMSFSQQGPRGVCILSANGTVSRVTLRQPSSGGTVTYEGIFEILSLTGSSLLTDDGGSRNRSGGLSICLSSPDGRVIGGGVGGMLMAASPVQVIVGSFTHRGSKSKNKAKSDQELVPESEPPTGEKQSTPSSAPVIQSFNPGTMGGWPASRQTDIRNPNFRIDLTQG